MFANKFYGLLPQDYTTLNLSTWITHKKCGKSKLKKTQ